MKRKRHNPEQIIRKLREADRLLSKGKDIAFVCQSLEVSEATTALTRTAPSLRSSIFGAAFLCCALISLGALTGPRDAFGSMQEASTDTQAQELYGRAKQAIEDGKISLAQALGTEASALAQENEDEELRLRCLLLLGSAARFTGDFQRAQALFEEGLALSSKVDEANVYSFRNGLAVCQAMQGDSESAISTWFDALGDLDVSKDAELLVATRLNIGIVLSDRNEHSKAVEVLLPALELAEQNELLKLASDVHHTLSISFLRMDLDEDARRHRDASISSREEAGLPLLGYHLIALGLDKFDAGSYELAAERFDEAIRAAQESGTSSQEADAWRQLSRASEALGRLKVAEEQARASLAISGQIDYPVAHSMGLAHLGTLLLGMERYEEALVELIAAYELATSVEHAPVRILASKGLSKCYRALGRFEEALVQHQQWTDLHFESLNMEHAEEVGRVQAAHKFELQQEADESKRRLEAHALAERERSARWRNRTYAGGALLTAIAILAFVAHRLRVRMLRTHNDALQSEIHEREAIQDQLRESTKMEAVGRLASGIAHDFNNVLTAIMGHAEFVKLKPTLVTSSVEVIQDCCEHAAALTHQLLAFSAQQVLKPRVIDPSEVMRRLEPMLNLLMPESVLLKFHLAENPPSIRFDASQMEQVVMNLVLNARDAMPGGGRLTVELETLELDDAFTSRHPGSKAGPHIRLVVTDTGEGMTEEVLTSVFEPFFTTKGSKGTGLGLASVHGIVRQSGGHILVYSEPGKGTSFNVHIPTVEGEPVQLLPTSRELLNLRGHETILVCEDFESVRNSVSLTLRMWGYEVLAAASPAEAIELASSSTEPLALLLTDVVMPGIMGPQLATKIREVHPKVCVVLMSGHTRNVVAHQTVLEGESEFIEKPFQQRQLLQSVRSVIDRANTPPA